MTAIIGKLSQFLLELGKGFAFVTRQKRITFDDDHLFIDLVFYNILLKCHLLIDLKLGKLTDQDVGQMDSYVRIFNAHERTPSDGPTIGLILCSEANHTIARYSARSRKLTEVGAMLSRILLSCLETAATDNGFDQGLPRQGDWLVFASTLCPLRVWLPKPIGAVVVSLGLVGNVDLRGRNSRDV